MPVEDPAVTERQMYVNLALGGVDDPSLSLAELRDMTGGGVNAARAGIAPIPEQQAPPLVFGGVRWVALGDSLTSLAGGGPPYMGWTTQAEILSAGKLRAVHNGGIVGNNAADVLARVPNMLAYKPTLVSIWVGTNDIIQGRSLSAYQTEMTAIIDAFEAASVTIAVLTIPPRADLSKTAEINKWNGWLKEICRDRNLHLIDVYDVLVDRTTGAFAAGCDYGDGIHMTQLAHNRVADLFVDIMLPRVVASSPLSPLTNADPNNLLSNGLLLTGGGAVPTSWTAGGGSAVGYTEGRVDDADFRGKAWQVAAVNPASFRQFNQIAPSGWAVGDELLFTCRLKVVSSSGVPETFGLNVNCNLYGSSGVNHAVQNASISGLSGITSKRLVVPPGTTDVQIDCVFNPTAAGTVTWRVGEFAIYNLTALGLT